MKITTTETTIEPFPCARSRLQRAQIPALAAEVRAYLRRLRAAEMAAWERSGGDYLLPECADGVECVAIGA